MSVGTRKIKNKRGRVTRETKTLDRAIILRNMRKKFIKKKLYSICTRISGLKLIKKKLCIYIVRARKKKILRSSSFEVF